VTLSPPALEVLLAFADDELLVGHRHSEWLGLAPFLEKDLAFASIAQDEIGHARALYSLTGADDVDTFPLRREPEAFRSAWLAELPGHPWEQALVRHLLYDTAERLRWENLLHSSVPDLAGVAAKAAAEEAYHTRHAEDLFGRMLLGGHEARARMVEQVAALLPLGLGLFEATAGEAEAVAEGVLARPLADLLPAWRDEITAACGRGGVTLAWPAAPEGAGARRGARSAHFADALATMTAVFAVDPSAHW